MESKEIIKDINSIYEKFGIPKNLQEHMRRAAAIGKMICENWKGEKINKDDIVAVLLLHDLGNIVKFDLDSEEGLNILKDRRKNVEKLRKIKKEIIEKYGEDDHKVTDKMSRELGVNDRILFLLNNKIFIKNKEVCSSDDFDLKICTYADQRVSPSGIMGLKERLDEAKARGSKSLQHPDADLLVECALKIEKQVLDNTNLSAEDINDSSIKNYLN